MAQSVVLQGGPELRARLAAIGQPFRPIGAAWQKAGSEQMRSTAPARTGHLRGSIRAGFLSDTGAAIMGDYTAIFVDRGTKAHDIKAKNGKALRFEVNGETIFARKVHHRRTARRPFVTQAAQQAIRGWSDEIVKLWNRKAEKGRWRLSK
jgi:hypothetical protein